MPHEHPASWYASQPIPARLLRDLEADVSVSRYARVEIPRTVERTLTVRRRPLSLVELAHVRATHRLVRQVRR